MLLHQARLTPSDWTLVTHLIQRGPTFTRDYAVELACGIAPQDLADRSLNESIEYMRYAWATPGQGAQPGHPSERVDDAWHALVLAMRVYERLCNDMFGAMLYHEPEIAGERRTSALNTMHDMVRRGFYVDEAMWTGPAAWSTGQGDMRPGVAAGR